MLNYQIGSMAIEADEADYLGFNREELLESYWNSHPRFRFLKDCRFNANLLDVGANNGGLFFWKQWSKPDRADIKITGVDLEKGEFFDLLDDYRVINIDNKVLPFEDDSFNTIMISNVGEHIENFVLDENNKGDTDIALLNEISRVLEIGGKCYIELPSQSTKKAPSKKLFNEKGIEISTVNFYDDVTHIETLDPQELVNECKKVGLKVLQGGIIENEYLSNKLISFGIINKDKELMTYGVWLKLKSEHYLILTK